MGCSRLLNLCLVLHLTHCLDMSGIETDIEIENPVTGILGEDIFLRCLYLGENDITDASWRRLDIRTKRMKKLTGYKNTGPFTNDPEFSVPASPTNLTVKVRVSSLEAQGMYTCVFATDEEEITKSMFLTVLAQPDIHTFVTEDTVNNTHYQSVTCSATNGKPTALIGWEINGSPPPDDYFTVALKNSSNTNSTGTVTSTLRFPTHRQDEGRVTCVVQHPTLPNLSTKVTVRVDTFMAPNMSIQTDLVVEEGKEFWVVKCAATGGRPQPNITLALPNQEVSLMLQKEDIVDASGTWVRSFLLSTEFHEGENITCLFDHPKLPQTELRAITLPTFYLSAVRLLNSELADSFDMNQAVESLVLKEGQRQTIIGLEVAGTVPRYSIKCSKGKQPLPEGVLVNGSALTLQGPVELHHAGLYECEASYYKHRASVLLDIMVTPRVTQPVAVPPIMSVDVQDRLGERFVECLAADSVPVANVSWVLPEGLSGPSWSNVTSHNGSHTVSSVVLLPACSASQLYMECVIDHSAFVLPERIQITLPACATPNISIQSSFEWSEDVAYTTVRCAVDRVRPAANLSWSLGEWDSARHNSTSHLMEVQEQVQVQPGVNSNGSVTVLGLVRFPSVMLAGQNVTCVVDHLGLQRPERRRIQLPGLESPVMGAFVVMQKGSPLWLAVCEYRGDGLRANLSWVLPEDATGQTSLVSAYEGMTVQTNLTYEFPLALHEGQDLTCLIQNQHGLNERRKVHVPRYDIKSIRVLNETTPLYKPYGGELVIHRLALKENLHNQRILLKVYGTVPTYKLTCHRSDGSFVPMEAQALVVHTVELETVLYTCIASYYHHQASVLIQVEVTSEDQQLMTVFMVCVSSSAAIMIVLIVALCIFCKRNEEEHPKSKTYMKQESLATLTPLTQEPDSPNFRKGNGAGGESQEYAQLLSYSIVIDVRSTV
ncbi:hypothetical protein UPYG_G00199960 [Umbra pygmaea]|uniref:Ig-like domain-containing protein n=1 Tax=Umbra pygmaea TaxID=75934 RepID=A0ABD0X8J5_UMBPY